MSMLDVIRQAKESGDFGRFLTAIPYFAFLGLAIEETPEGPVCILPADERFIGNPRLPALHGGVVGALLESAAVVQLVWQSEAVHIPKTINLSVDYLRSARPVRTFARGIVTKHGRRVANVRVEAWQDDPARPVAAAKAHFLLG
ncbi:MAG: PaaI family thioesterase [Alphaproteobacteria bacterium]|nr:PaaI family thioesterase [Alphaproteobacteria bacterium]